jgi:hypothetical protein
MITPQQKARELVDKFEFSFAGMISNEEDWETLAKQCALIAVEEILKANVVWYEGSIPYKYWIAVQQEIQKL